MNFSKEEVESCVKVLKDGGVILYPTDTVWGLGCDATNSEAINKIGDIKRNRKGPYILGVDNDGRLFNLFKEIPEVAWDILDLSEKPTTLILPGAMNLAPEVIAEDGSAGIRIIKEPFVQAVIRKFGKPIVSTSANISGQPTPSYFNEVSDDIKNAVDHIVAYRQDDTRPFKSSSIIKLGLKGEVKVIR